MSIQAIADVLEVQPATVSNGLFRAAKQKERSRKPVIVPDKNPKYAQVVRNKQGRKLQKIEKKSYL